MNIEHGLAAKADIPGRVRNVYVPPPISPLSPFSSVIFAAHSRLSHVPCWLMSKSTEPASVTTQYLYPHSSRS